MIYASNNVRMLSKFCNEKCPRRLNMHIEPLNIDIWTFSQDKFLDVFNQ